MKKLLNPDALPGISDGIASRALLFILPLLIISTASIAGVPESNHINGSDFHLTPVSALLFNDDHNSEGFLAPLDNGNILLIFRIDPGIEGNHVGTGGYIAKITYYPEEDRWGEPETVYNSNRFDDRNIHGGVTREGRIVIFFRHLAETDEGRQTEGRYFMYSDDNGKTWSEPLPANIPHSGHWGAAPQLIYDRERDLLLALTSDRYTRDPSENSLFIYSAHPADIFGNPQNWTLEHVIQRPGLTAFLYRVKVISGKDAPQSL